MTASLLFQHLQALKRGSATTGMLRYVEHTRMQETFA